MSCFVSLTGSLWKQKVPDLLQVVPLSGCNQDHVDNLTRLISERNAMSCFYHSQNTCCTMETGPVEVYIYMSSYQNFIAGHPGCMRCLFGFRFSTSLACIFGKTRDCSHLKINTNDYLFLSLLTTRAYWKTAASRRACKNRKIRMGIRDIYPMSHRELD